jgi:hypothetical protein
MLLPSLSVVPSKPLVAEVFPSAGFRVNIQFKTMSEALEFKHSSISSANNSQNRDERDQSAIRENDNDIVSEVTSNNISNATDTIAKKEDVTKNVNKQKQSALIPANVLCPIVDGDNNQTSKSPQDFTPPPPVPKSQRNAPKLGAKKK